MWSIFENGKQLTQQEFYSKLHAADVILLGEYHNNVQGHIIEEMIIDEILSKTPSAAVAMEMFERHYQEIVNAFMKGDISSITLEKSTFGSNWGGGENTWQDWYQPIVNTVKKYYTQGAQLIAANASNSYVKIASHEGYKPLQTLKDNGNDYFELPDPEVDVSEYIQNLKALRRHIQTLKDRGLIPQISSMKSKGNTSNKKITESAVPIDSQGEFFYAQQLWDATMSHSVAQAFQVHPKVVLVIGDFHIKRNGGTTQRIKHFLPDAKVLNVSIISVVDPSIWSNEHQNHADLIVYTQAPKITP